MSSRLIFLLIAVVSSWVLAFNTGRNLAFNLAYLISSLLILSYLWAWNSIRGIKMRRVTRTRRSQVGQFAEEQFEVINQSRWPKLWLEVEDFSTFPWHDASRVINSLGARATHRWQVRTLCSQRGRFRLGSMSIHGGDPLGIFEVEQHFPNTSHMVVYPLTFDLTSFEPSISDLSGGEARRRRTLQVTTSVSGVRDYAPGDSLNRIHWPTTARARRLMTKEFELDPTADIWLYLDLYHGAEVSQPWVPPPPEPGLFALRGRSRAKFLVELPPNTTEYTITVATSLARYFLAKDRSVGMSMQGHRREFLQTDRGERQLTKIMETLAVMEAGGRLPFAQLVSTDSMRLNRNDTVIAISPDPNPEWARALYQMQRRGVNSVAIIIDRNSFGEIDDYAPVYSELAITNIPTYSIYCGGPIDEALSEPINLNELV